MQHLSSIKRQTSNYEENKLNQVSRNNDKMDEGLASVASSKLADLARAVIFKARPIIVLYHPKLNSTITLKLKRGLIRHTLEQEHRGQTKVLARGISAVVLITKALNESRKRLTQGYMEI